MHILEKLKGFNHQHSSGSAGSEKGGHNPSGLRTRAPLITPDTAGPAMQPLPKPEPAALSLSPATPPPDRIPERHCLGRESEEPASPRQLAGAGPVLSSTMVGVSPERRSASRGPWCQESGKAPAQGEGAVRALSRTPTPALTITPLSPRWSVS